MKYSNTRLKYNDLKVERTLTMSQLNKSLETRVYYMSIIINITLEGNLEGLKKHVDVQRNSIFFRGKTISAMIQHTDRKMTNCYKSIRVGDEAINSWKSDNCPSWVSTREWRKLSGNMRMLSHINSFDEGFGVTFQEV